MKKSLFSLFFGLLSLAVCGQEFEQIELFDLDPLEIECSITCESPDSNYYEIGWSIPYLDSMAKAENRLPYSELHCYVRDSSGTIGFYTGLSTPMRHCGFRTKDSLVEVYFRIRSLYYNGDSAEVVVTASGSSLYEPSHRGSEFERVQLSVHSTNEKKLTLRGDTNTVKLAYGTPSRLDPLGYPTIIGIKDLSVITLDRYYLDLETGRIATGQRWVNRKGPGKIGQNIEQYVLVSPTVQYRDINNQQHPGSELIEARKIKLKEFDLEDFRRVDLENHPY